MRVGQRRMMIVWNTHSVSDESPTYAMHPIPASYRASSLSVAMKVVVRGDQADNPWKVEIEAPTERYGRGHIAQMCATIPMRERHLEFSVVSCFWEVKVRRACSVRFL